MKTSKFFVSTLIAAAAMTATAYAEKVTLNNGVKTSVSDIGAGNTYVYSTPESGADNGGWIFLGNLAGTENVALGTAAAQASFSGSGIVGIGYQGGNGGVVYNFDLTNVDASAFSGSLMVVNEWNNSTNVKVSGETWKNTTYIFAGASHEIWTSSSYEGTPPWRMYNNTSRGKDTLMLAGNTTFSGIKGTSKGFTVTNADGVVVSTNAYEFISAETKETVLTIAGAGTNSFYGTVGSSTVAVGISMTGTGTQVFGGTNYFDVASTVVGSTLDLSGSTTNIAGAVTNAGTLDLSGATVSLSYAIQNSGNVKVSDTTVFALGNLTAVETGVYTLFTNSEGASVSWADGMGIANVDLTGTDIVARDASAVFSATGVTVTAGTAGNLVWAGTTGDATWNSSAENWTLDGSGTTFMTGDNVTFGASAENKTVSLENGANLTVGTATISGGDYTFASNSSGTATLAGKTLTVSTGASLTVGSTKNNTVNLEFENIVLSGKISYDNGDDTWSSLDLAGGELHIYDGANPGTNLTINSVTVSQDSTITATWNKSLNIGALSGSANLSMTGGSSGNLTVNVTNLDSYSGTITTNNGNWGLTLNLGADNLTQSSAANLIVNSGTVNIAGTTTLTGAVTQTGGSLSLGENVEISTINVGTAAISATEGASVGTLYFGYGNGAETVTISGSLEVTENVVHSNVGKINGETITLAEGASLEVTGTFGTTATNAVDTGQVSYTLNVGKNASFTAGEIAHGDELTVMLGEGASVSADEMTLNSVWAAKTHSFTGAGAETSKISVETLNLKGSEGKGTTLKIDSARMDIGTVNGGSTIANLSLVNATLGVTATSDSGWSTAAGVALSGENTIATSEGKPITLSGNISDGSSAGSLIAKGAGTLTLSGANTHTGGTYIWSGATVVAGSETALGSGNVNVEGELSLDTGNVSVKNLSGNANGVIALGTLSQATVTITSDEDTTFAGAFSEGGLPSNQSLALNIVKNGDAALTLSSTTGSSALTAPSTISVNAGTLVAASANAFGGGSTSYNGSVYSGATVSVADGATLKIAAESVQAAAVTLAEGAKFAIDVTSMNPISTLSETESVSLNILASSALRFNEQEASSLTSAEIETYFDEGSSDLGEWAEWNREWSYAEGTLFLTMTIPEPSAFGLLAGVGALALVASRRRRSRR